MIEKDELVVDWLEVPRVTSADSVPVRGLETGVPFGGFRAPEVYKAPVAEAPVCEGKEPKLPAVRLVCTPNS